MPLISRTPATRLKRYAVLFSTASAFCFLTLWLRSLAVLDSLGRDDASGRRWAIVTHPGGFWIVVNPPGAAVGPHGWYSESYGGPTARRSTAFAAEPFAWRTLGVQVARFPDARGIRVPFWLLIAVLGIMPANALRHHLRWRRRTKDGLCLKCGYDLRASPSGCCPECGYSNHREAEPGTRP